MLTMKLILDRLDKDDRLLEKREQQSRSFLIQFMQFLKSRQDADDYALQDITDTSRTVDVGEPGNLRVASCGGHAGAAPNDIWSEFAKGVEEEKIGIQVGTGTTAPTPTDYAMETRIAHGQAAGEFEYGGTELLALVFSDPNGEFTIRRYFTNVSGGEITVNEVGIYAQVITTTAFYAACIARDKVDPGVAVANTEILRVTYVPQITV